MAEPFYRPTGRTQEFPIFRPLPTLVIFCFPVIFFFFNICYSSGCEVISHCGFYLICISLMVSDVEHLFLGLLTIYITCLEKYLLKSVAIFSQLLLLLLLIISKTFA